MSSILKKYSRVSKAQLLQTVSPGILSLSDNSVSQLSGKPKTKTSHKSWRFIQSHSKARLRIFPYVGAKFTHPKPIKRTFARARISRYVGVKLIHPKSIESTPVCCPLGTGPDFIHAGQQETGSTAMPAAPK